MNYFNDIYKKRVNRYGLNYQERLQTQREKNFDLYLLKTVYRVDFLFDGAEVAGSLERYKQNTTRTLQYLLTKTSVNIPGGTILFIPNKDNVEEPWMIYYLENIKASGYNRYIVIKMSHYLTWELDGEQHSSWVYLHGPGSVIIKDDLPSDKPAATIYGEDDNAYWVIMPRNQYMKKDLYIEIGEGEFKQQFMVMGYDIQSTEGVEYVSFEPTLARDHTPTPESDGSDEFYWLTGGH